MTTPAPVRTLVDLLAGSVARYSTRTLFLDKRQGSWVETTYREFSRVVDGVRGGLAAVGVGPGDRVGVIAANRIEWAAIAYATYQLGAAIVPMYESQLESDWAFIIRDAGLKVLFVSNDHIYRKVAAFRGSISTLRHVLQLDEGGADPLVTYAGLLEQGLRAPAPVRAVASEEVACLMYTSGTTGEPKGVVLSHGNIVSNIVILQSLLPMAQHHRTLSFLPWAHAFGHTVELHMVIACGASMAIAEGIDLILNNLAEVRPTVLVAVPRVFMRAYAAVEQGLAVRPKLIRWLAREGLAAGRKRATGEPLDIRERILRWLADRLVMSKVRRRLGGRLEYAVSGAAALPRDVAEFVEALGITVYEGYGLTETSPVVAANVPGHRKLGSVGRPLPGVRVVIDTAAPGADPPHGEIVVFGPNVMRGYHGRAAETAAVLTESGGLRTGDLGYLDEGGYLFITGRIKEQYKLANGKYVSPALLEEALRVSPFISDVMIYGENWAHNVALIVPNGEAVRAWAAGEGIEAVDDASLLQHPGVRRKLTLEIERRSASFRHYERIAAFALLSEEEAFTQENGMLTPSLKLKRRNIVRRWRAELDHLSSSEAFDVRAGA